MRMSGTWIGFD